jgi:hypothetical protein
MLPSWAPNSGYTPSTASTLRVAGGRGESAPDRLQARVQAAENSGDREDGFDWRAYRQRDCESQSRFRC